MRNLKPAINPLHMAQFHTPHTTVIRVELNKTEIFFVSSYFQFAHDMDPYLNQLKRILDALPGKPIVISADANAKSELWYNDFTDARGEQLEEFIDQNDLLIINEPGHQATHVAGNNIDVTLATSSAARLIHSWEVDPDASLSDHRLIKMQIGLRSGELEQQPNQLNFRRVDFADLSMVALDKLRLLPYTDRAEDQATEIQNAIKKAIEEKVPQRRPRTRRVPWWTVKLTKLNKKTKYHRRKYQRCAPGEGKVRLREIFTESRRLFKTEVKKAKRSSWERFVSSNLNEDPFGFAFKFAMGKLKLQSVLNTVQVQGAHTSSVVET